MPKMKTNRAAAKRFKKTANGHFKHKKSGLRHGMISKSRKRLRNLRKHGLVHDSFEDHLRRLLPYA